MNFAKLALSLTCGAAVLATAAAVSAQEASSAHDLARTTEMAAEAGKATVADSFTPGPAEVPAAQPLAPAPRSAYRNPWTSPRPSLREAFSQMAAAFRGEFQQTLPPPRSLAAADGPEPAFDRADHIDFTVADAFDATRPAAPAASSQGVLASARVGERDDGVARARALNLAAAEDNKDAASAIEAYEAARRSYEDELGRWREQLAQ